MYSARIFTWINNYEDPSFGMHLEKFITTEDVWGLLDKFV